MDQKRIDLADRIGFGGRVVAIALGLPIYLSLLTTLPAVAATLGIALYIGVPVALRRAVLDPGYQSSGSR